MTRRRLALPSTTNERPPQGLHRGSELSHAKPTGALSPLGPGSEIKTSLSLQTAANVEQFSWKLQFDICQHFPWLVHVAVTCLPFAPACGFPRLVGYASLAAAIQ
eukprot:1576502-Amphidinium_carterae.1